MRDAGAQDITTVTVGFDEFRGLPQDETPLAAEVARLYGTRHTTRIVTRAEFEADLPRIMAAMDQPSIDGINTWFVAKAARELGLKVAVSGLGGDELLGGYPSFRNLPRWVWAMALPSRMPLPRPLLRSIAALAAGVLGVHPKAAGMIEYGGSYAGAYLLNRGLFMPWELDRVLDPELVRQGLERLRPVLMIDAQLNPRPHSAFARVATLESSFYLRNQLLRDTDWASMAHSLEVRVPLVDSMLLARLAPLAVQAHLERPGAGKGLMAETPSPPIPQAIRGRAKTGFATPIEAWMTKHVKIAAIPRPGARRRPAPWARAWSCVVAEQMRAAV